MRQAPAIRLVTTQARRWRALEATGCALAAAACGAWGALHAELGPAAVAGVAFTAAVAAGALRWLAGADEPIVIDWDGSTWTLDPGTPRSIGLSRLEVILDLDDFLLLRAVTVPPRRRRQWIALDLGRDPASERTLCVALYAARSGRASVAAGPGLPGS